MNGYAVSAEYRHYFSGVTTGWHVDPFAEWIGFERLGSLRTFYGSGLRSAFDFGVVAGHEWTANRLIFDISLRTSWYTSDSYPRGDYFPRMENSSFNSFMLITLGYLIN